MDGVSLPVCTYLPTPPITKEAKTAKFHGVVVILGVVELDGRIAKIRVIKGAGLALDESAINALKKWKCKPPLKDGKPVLADTSFLFRFDAD
jgi:protein TonB